MHGCEVNIKVGVKILNGYLDMLRKPKCDRKTDGHLESFILSTKWPGYKKRAN